MVLRLFVPPGEDQHPIVPKRPDPLGANATLQYAVVSSTALAAGYAAFAAKLTQRVTPRAAVSRTALFITASARLGVWAALGGAAVNAYYHWGFTSVVLAQTIKDPKPAKVWEKTDKYTVEDGCLAGAAAGVVTFLPTLLMRRVNVSWRARLVGMVNAGACTGVVGSHAYFQYTGERQTAMEELHRQRRRRTLEFHHIFWNKLLMAKFDPLIQQYVRHNGIFRAYLLPAEVYSKPEKYGILSTAKSATTDTPSAANKTPDNSVAYYMPAPDHAQHLKTMSVESIQKEVEWCEETKQSLLKEAEYMAHQLSQKQYEFCHKDNLNEEDRQALLRELQLIGIAFNRIRANADELDRRVFFGALWLKQKAAWESNDARADWLSSLTTCEPESHDPALSITEMKKIQEQLSSELSRFEALAKSNKKEDLAKRQRWKKDLDDARTMLRAADQVVFDLEKIVKEVEKAAPKVVKVDQPPGNLEPEKP